MAVTLPMHSGVEPRLIVMQRRACAGPLEDQPVNSRPGVSP
ncbi:hypothetical protein BSU04_04360 [Caballeronia sordidicola]|uniref:Uncharacterized protein n=1 Tax=Caballeronia sordidicola TaxID=196367 RepID=A0A226XAM3_CABSO|nr:hypothetical protein BSU04_04360 [Caballeronia sordidicola]